MTDQSIADLLDATRLTGLHTTDTGRIVAQIQRLDAAGTAYRSELVEVDGEDLLPLTRGAASIGGVELAEDGTTFFTAKRVGEDGKEADDAQLWALPARGEARELATRPGGFGGFTLIEGGADGTGRKLVVQLAVHSQASDEAEHAELTGKRKKAKVSGVLHDSFPTRFWNQDLGPSRNLLAIADLPADLAWAQPSTDPDAPSAESSSATADDDDEDAASKQLLHFRYLAMPPGRLGGWTVNDQGTTALVGMKDSFDDKLDVVRLYRLDLTGRSAPELLLDATTEVQYGPGPFSPDGTRALIGRHHRWTETTSPHTELLLFDVAAGTVERELWPDHDFDVAPVWLDDATIVAGSDDHGRGSVWIGGLADAAPRRLAGGPEQDLAFGGVSVAGSAVVASVSGIAVAPYPVSIDTASGEVTELPNPADAIDQTGTLTEVTATAEDGAEVRAWLRLPEGEGPHPLVVFAHGGPWGSWNAWTFRWNPNPFVAAGYAVLLPDPAISTGYGQKMIDRGQQELGGAPYTDIMALTDATIARNDVDADRTAFAGGSYGGYMANWVAGHTGDRFRCIVAHAAGWDMEAKNHTNDNASWERPMRPQNEIYSPHRFVRDIEVPILITHGAKDFRVPIAQAHHLWYDLQEFSSTPRDEEGRTRHRFLYFPNEGHWIQGRGNAEVWYETLLGFLDDHVHGKEWEQPVVLG